MPNKSEALARTPPDALSVKEGPAVLRGLPPNAFRKPENTPATGETPKAGPPTPAEPPAIPEIAIQLDNYDDIFSDFDPRPYANRELSDDFLKELGRRYLERRQGGFEVLFHIPATERDAKHEAVIKKRLREHFSRELRDVRGQLSRRKRMGITYLFVGFSLLALETYIAIQSADSLWPRLADLLLVPGGWFFFWTGLDKLLEGPANLRQLESFYEKFIRCNYLFVTQDES